MPHDHHNHSCADESHDHDHDHDHDTSDLGPQDNLYNHVDRGVVRALNASNGEGPEVIKPWNERMDETKVRYIPKLAFMEGLERTRQFLESDADDQMIIRVPFTGAVRLRSILLKTGPADQTPSKVVLFANAAEMDFDDVADKTPTQEFDVAQGREVGEYAVKTAKFSNISSITLFFPGSQGADTTRIYYVGFLGHWQERNTSIPVTVYEAQANLADHEKIAGTDGNFSRLGA